MLISICFKWCYSAILTIMLITVCFKLCYSAIFIVMLISLNVLGSAIVHYLS